MKWAGIYAVLISVIRTVVTNDVVAVIKRAIDEWSAAAEDGWQEGERTNFVIGQARAYAATTPNLYDDVLVEVLGRLYVAYFVAKGKAPAASKG